MEEGHAMEDDVNEINTTLLGLQQAFAAAMRESGVMGKMRAQLRAAAIGVIRADPCLRDSALGTVLQPAELPLEGRVALLLIEDFLRTHGLKLAGGVFEEECNISMVGEAERHIVEQQRQYQPNQGTPRSSLLESLLARVIDPRECQQLQQQKTGAAPIAHALPHLGQSVAPSPAAATSTTHTVKRERRRPAAELSVPLEVQGRSEITAWLKEYEDSVDFSDSSLEDMPCVDEQTFDAVIHL
ncbi:hypothetical protein, conserved [Trypanosoma brucei gambiense DAL972]|uniref:Uncharacterized protein n=2 Tax=Trypanosoma brucei TaxID=5691 RepID=C9ZPU5_TRYB9|nr:hypothetical protein, conserved [Trypanosoma brucei gambiense DAL972]RHW72525.1 hypothetical protein DPX39_050047800 [Trypanosoma brucei equiperdum]CBH11423.1 hypothetical protein, conserved [Trypanosoma brucei gambiense DAL972]|eukprot:XP_011773710.1 hypothetical protein, conserved [Trypanosoma brucei gambiense DAL972]